MMADETALEAERAAEEAPFVDAETFGVDATEGTAAGGGNRRSLGQIANGYPPGGAFPPGEYLAALGVYAGGVGLVALVARLTRRQVQAPAPWDVLVGASATHQLSKLDTRADGAGRPAGALLTSPACARMWMVTGLSAGYVFAPRTTRLAAAGLAALTGSDFLQYARAKLK